MQRSMVIFHQDPVLYPSWGTSCRWIEEAFLSVSFMHLVFPGVGWIILMIAGLLRKVYGAVEQTMDVRGKQNALVIQHAPLDQRLQEKHGDVFTVHLGPRPVVVLCGTQTIREALVNNAEAFSGRGTIAAAQLVMQDYGIFFSSGERWKTLRRFSLATMKEFGMGKRSVEERIKEEAQCLVEELKKYQGAPLDPTFFFQCVTANIICSIVFGERFDYTDEQFLRLLNLMYQIYSLLRSFSCQEKSNHNTEFHHQNLMMSVLSLFFAGTETTSTTLCCGFLLMLMYPHVAEKVQKEIDQVIGSHRLPTLDDRTKMPYTDAVIHEIQRFSDIVPTGAPHRVTKDTMFRGYLLPKNTEVYPILSSALHDPQYFEQPDSFNPDHFLDANGALKKSEAFLPFSTGKRICLGESIARNELFLFFTSILQNFSVASPVASKDIDLTPKESGIGKIPPTYQICFLAR
ncbi:cytochrome P450, family 2, subfamily b, polypeptide 13 isoform X2 [Mus musculus]|uniref:cytochrome P450, family 2, subfamily b, polypeptide 13 isoform X2 n=1 Tax=Mus musculus TaxID=10090 RepID=UPI0003D76B30|nr:cytochrome P450, family 2, subfamily b, polypeptide 13 isoform X2 [Mus musculus]|eukprot:XP_006539573.1 PREDICTED: cytochrome P450, family 2, subfamily b, polypeptide 13 isoform X2 [Mus musculus]